MLYMCPECKETGSCGKCCTDEPIPIDNEAMIVEKYKLKSIQLAYEAELAKLSERIERGEEIMAVINTKQGGHNEY